MYNWFFFPAASRMSLIIFCAPILLTALLAYTGNNFKLLRDPFLEGIPAYSLNFVQTTSTEITQLYRLAKRDFLTPCSGF